MFVLPLRHKQVKSEYACYRDSVRNDLVVHTLFYLQPDIVRVHIICDVAYMDAVSTYW